MGISVCWSGIRRPRRRGAPLSAGPCLREPRTFRHDGRRLGRAPAAAWAASPRVVVTRRCAHRPVRANRWRARVHRSPTLFQRGAIGVRRIGICVPVGATRSRPVRAARGSRQRIVRGRGSARLLRACGRRGVRHILAARRVFRGHSRWLDAARRHRVASVLRGWRCAASALGRRGPAWHARRSRMRARICAARPKRSVCPARTRMCD